MRTIRARVIAFLCIPLLVIPFIIGFSAPASQTAIPLTNLPQPASTPTIDRLAIPTPPDNPTLWDNGRIEYYYHCMPCHGDQGQGLTDEWRAVWEEDHQNCWGRGCHGGREKDEGFPIPKYIPPVTGVVHSPRFESLVPGFGLYAYLYTTHPPQRPGSLTSEEYWALAAYLLHSELPVVQPEASAGPVASPYWPIVALLVAAPVAALIALLARRRHSPTHTRAATQASYNRLSRWYDALAGSSERQLMEVGLEQLAPQAGERMLEIGFGTGHGLAALARGVGESGQVSGIDLSPGMAAATQKRLRQVGPASNVYLQIADGLQLPYRAASFDAVFMSFTLELFDAAEIPLVLAECRRVLRSDGRLGVVAMSAGKINLMTRLYEWAHQRFPNTIDCRPIEVAAALEAAGFDVLKQVDAATWGLPVSIVLTRIP
jgi:demethylmenaquinone methyltransferase/2-methoxy-6-polyprenyl-1,4-benzoquinol methylase